MAICARPVRCWLQGSLGTVLYPHAIHQKAGSIWESKPAAPQAHDFQSRVLLTFYTPLAAPPKNIFSPSPLHTATVEQTRGQRQTGCNDLPDKGERVAKWMVEVKSKKC